MASRANQAEQAIRELREVPEKTSRLPMRMNQSLCVTIMKDAWREEDINLEDPGELDQYWFEEDGFVVIDLRGADG